VARRIHVPVLRPGELILAPAEAHHARDVLRLETGSAVEVFDDAGAVSDGSLVLRGTQVAVRVERVRAGEGASDAKGIALTVAAAVPKGERADWMIEKLSELGVATFIPLAAARSVVLPEGRNKRERWVRIATESAKQSRRVGVMGIAPLTPTSALLDQLRPASGSNMPHVTNHSPALSAWYLSTDPAARPIAHALHDLPRSAALTALIGPEGGWTEGEHAAFAATSLTPIRLTRTVLRVETAAIAVAAVVGSVENE
jgi:16S rRNA (uracil1498-N3)-methyltransferase